MLILIEVPVENVIFDVMTSILLSVTNDLATDQRVHRVATTLTKNGAKVTLVGRLLKNSLPLNRGYKTYRMRLLFTKGPFFYAEYNVRLFLYLAFSRVDILVANDLDTLPANYLVSVLRRKKIVYDTHEYFCGVPELQDRKLVQAIWRKIEQFIFPRLIYIYTVNISIALLYEEEYGKKIDIVRNVPMRIERDNWPGRSDLGLPEDKKIILLQGAGININRGAEEALRAVLYLNNVILLIIGGGDVINTLKMMASEMELGEKVIFKPKMPYDELICYTRLADIGLSLDKDTNINYRYSLPNKLFDYIQAQIPVLCSNLVEVVNVVNTWQIGKIVESHEPKYLASIIREMLENIHQINMWKKNLAKAAEELCWEKEEQMLMGIYGKLISPVKDVRNMKIV